jgi:hypothetical protein
MMPMTADDALELVLQAMLTVLPLEADQPSARDSDTPLVGEGRLMDSMHLIDLCLQLEDRARELGFEFDWTSDAAMSRSHSIFASAGALAAEFARQHRAGSAGQS